MASLGTKTINEDDSEESFDSNDKIKMGKSRNGSIILIEFKGRKRFIRINLDDTKGISITLQVSVSLNYLAFQAKYNRNKHNENFSLI